MRHAPTAAPARRRRLVAALLVLPLVAAACSSSDSDGGSGATKATTTTTTAPTRSTPPAEPIVFNGQGNNLDAYATTPKADGTFPTQRVWETVATNPAHGRDLNAQICFLPRTKDGEQWYIAGEDTGQTHPNRPAGWGIFRLEGNEVGSLKTVQIGKLVPTYQPTDDGPENYGCGRLPDGRILTTDVGNQAGGDGNGQLIIWFPPLTGGTYRHFDTVRYCKLDVTLPTAQSILVRGSDVYVAASRGGVFKYTGPFPTSDDAAGGCGKKDPTGAPMADTVHKETFIASGPHGLATPAGLANAPDDGFYVSSVFTGVIDEFGPDGSFRRTILEPPAGESLGEQTYSTGTPLGLGVDRNGTLYYADIGVIVTKDSAGPGDKTGSLRRIRFVDGKPQPPETMATPLDFPDGIGIFE